MAPTRATRFHLVRHGVVEERWLGRLYGDLDVELSAAGRQQAQFVAQRLAAVHFDLVASSDLQRARFGAECIAAGRAVEPRVEPSLREISRGDWAGRTIAELRRDQPGVLEAWHAAAETSAPPGGESVGDLRRRVLPTIDRLAAEFPGGEVCLVAHGWVIRTVVGWVLGLPAPQFVRLHLPPAAVAVVDWPAGAWTATAESGPASSPWGPSGPHRGAPNLVGLHLDEPPPPGRGWYRSPADAPHP
jgi:broad specificity phosphatase PhoE